jgi:uroporphyrinogen decarboxylase
MTPRDRIKNIIARKPVDRCGFWVGNPHPESLDAYHSYFGTSTLEELHTRLGSDFRWLSPQLMKSTYRGKEIFGVWQLKASLGDAGPFSECEDVKELDAFDWPRLEYLDFSECLRELEKARDYYRASGFWAPFFHDVMDLFGMESYLTKMYTHPEIVQAVTDRVCTFYYEANELFFDQAKDLIDGYFFGNDFGTQRDLLVSLDQFDEFVYPWFKKFTSQAHSRGYQVILHSCGSVHRVIDRLIAAGVECLHPLQARAAKMDAETLKRDFGGKISFLGGIDTQHILVNATPEEVKEEVRRVRRILGPDLIISPSHEALLPNVRPENVRAMAEAAAEQ